MMVVVGNKMVVKKMLAVSYCCGGTRLLIYKTGRVETKGPGTLCVRNERQHLHNIDFQVFIYLNRGASKLSFGISHVQSSRV